MKILYVSTVNSKEKYDHIFKESSGNLHSSNQKFHNLIINGLKANGCDITVLSGFQFSNKSYKKKLFPLEQEVEEDIKYWYPFIVNLPVLKHFFTIISFIYYFILWSIKNQDERYVIIDSSYVSVSPIIVFLCKLFKIKSACIVADIYNYMTLNVNKNQKRSLLHKISCKLCNYCWNNYDCFILLTKEMNSVINPKGKPFVVIEGLVDKNYKVITRNLKKRKAIMYAGGLNEKYGVKLLIDSFISWNNEEYELWLCGDGDLISYIKKLSHPRIKYFGKISNEKVLKLETQASLLVNPRFTKEEYTKYSFPSKTMEYMLSGTPVLSTKLSGIPKEYNDHVYFIKKETKKGVINCFNDIFSRDEAELNNKGKQAQKFVMNNKNNVIQTNKIINLIKKTKNNEKQTQNKTNKIENILIMTYLFFNLFFLILSNLNVYKLYHVSNRTYFLYFLSIIITVLGIKAVKNKKLDKKANNSTEDLLQKTVNNKVFVLFLHLTFVFVLLYLLKYLYVIKDLSIAEIRIAAFTKLYSNAFSAIFFIYIVSNAVKIIGLLIPIFLFKGKHSISKKILGYMLLIFLLYSFIGFSRLNFLFLIIIALFYILYFCDYKKLFSKKVLIVSLVSLFSIFLLSCFMLFFRTNSDKSITSFFTTILMQVEQIFIYFLGSFRTLDHFIVNGFSNIGDMTYGRATLAGIDEIVLYPIKLFSETTWSFNQLISPHTQSAIAVGTNTPYYNAFFTSVMNFYLDFKVFGVILFSFLHGIFIKKIILLYENKKTIIAEVLLLLVSYNLIISILKWEYQAGNIVFLITVLLIVEYKDKLRNIFWRKKNENTLDN